MSVVITTIILPRISLMKVTIYLFCYVMNSNRKLMLTITLPANVAPQMNINTYNYSKLFESITPKTAAMNKK